MSSSMGDGDENKKNNYVAVVATLQPDCLRLL